MYETHVTVTGVVASDPRVVQLHDGLRITSFRLASTTRRRGHDGDWVDGTTTWLTVTCWRGLAANVAESVLKKDRVVVRGRLRSREWTAVDGGKRTGVEVDADSVGHDLSFGTSVFTRVRRAEPVENAGRAEADERVRRGEPDAAQDGFPALPEDDPADSEAPADPCPVLVAGG